MKVDQGRFTSTFEHTSSLNQIIDKDVDVLIFVFGRMENGDNWYHLLREIYPNSSIVSCSSLEVIEGDSVIGDGIAYSAICFEKTTFRANSLKTDDFPSIFEAGKQLVEPLVATDLKCVLLFSDGKSINGSEVISGVNSVLDKRVIVSGGMAADGAKFVSTMVGYNELPENNMLVAVGLYGDALSVGFGSMGGWDAFGPKRLVTKSEGNILYELDGKNALELYKKYLGNQADNLPGSALLFPLALHKEHIHEYLVRTVLDVNEVDSSMVFAGDIPEGSLVQLMKTTFDRLIDGASVAAEQGVSSLNSEEAEFALLISCVGRKLVLGPRIEEEIEACASVFSSRTALAGFYSHGEFSPLKNNVGCQLHNQSMTITTFREN